MIQEYINNAECVGVIFTGNSKNGSQFRTINFNNSSHTELITSGKSNGQIIYYFKNMSKSRLPKRIQNIENLIKKIEKVSKYLFRYRILILKKQVYILQVRKLNSKKITKTKFVKSLKDLEKKLSKIINETSHLIGDCRYFSTMTDWNPAEIIGLKPKILLSLYQSLITKVWSKAESNLVIKM